MAGDIGLDTIGAWVIFVAFDLSLKASQTGKGLLSLLSLDRRNRLGCIGQEHRDQVDSEQNGVCRHRSIVQESDLC
jgi:hypothetical protein